MTTPDAFTVQTSLKDLLVLGASVTRVAMSVVLDKLRRATPRTRSEVPAHVRHITPSWLTDVLQATLPGAIVDTVSIDGESSGTSARGRLHLRYRAERNEQPVTMFAKSTPTFTTRIANGLSGTAPTEAGFYRQLRPRLQLEAPRGYHSAFDARSWRSIQIIEDLVGTKGATFCSPAHVVSAGEAEQIVHQLALLHAQGMRLPEVLHNRPHWLLTYPEWWRRSLSVIGVKRSHHRGMAAAVDNGLAPEALRGREHDIWAGFMRSVHEHRDLPQTLIHGDAHLGNWYVTASGELGLCDWQCVSVGHWSRDLAYALASTLNVGQRRAWERDLIETYLNQLQEEGGAANVDFDTAWQLYRRQVLGALVMWTPTYRPPPMMPDMQPTEVTEEMLRRISSAVDDLQSLSA
ncbi:aminoglycoside phosphotransferase family protein [Mycobacterium intracellulare]|uniref:aminoglycoside phosphotransferase family protein n=1 Tax=Mycobacterium intracellulare TaxID=1767 RepID=UPI0034D63DC6